MKDLEQPPHTAFLQQCFNPPFSLGKEKRALAFSLLWLRHLYAQHLHALRKCIVLTQTLCENTVTITPLLYAGVENIFFLPALKMKICLSYTRVSIYHIDG